jgi:uncharacterized membrane protein
MRKDRLLAFSDGVFAIIITIMVLDLKVPHDGTWAALFVLAPKFGSYLLSFIYVAIYWNNHHHMLESVERINGATLWANMALLFWLSLVPFTTAWMGETHFAVVPTAIYGVVLLLPAICYTILQRILIAAHPDNALLQQAVGADWKGKVSLALYAVGIALAFQNSMASLVLYAIVALMWLVPDQRIETVVSAKHRSPKD